MPTNKRKTVPPHVKDGVRKQAVKGEIRPPDLARLTAHFFDAAGGEKAVAKLLYEEFRAAHEGSVVRQRILDMILRATRYTSDRTPQVDDLGVLSDEDLDRELEVLMGDLADSLGVSGGEEEGDGPGRPLGAGQAEEGQPAGPGVATDASVPAGTTGPDDPAGAGAEFG